MKKILYLCISALILFGVSACTEWLDINDNPNTPTSDIAPVDARLAGMQHFFLYAYGSGGTRAAMITGAMTRTVAAGNAHNQLCAWDPIIGSATTPYQMFFVGCAANLEDLITKAEEEEAWHYVGVAKMIRAMGFMLMVDWYGEMPYTEALGKIITPKYDDGKTIFNGCLADLDEAITYLEKTQPATATALSKGDGWNGGNVQKWIKLAYGLKARWLNNLSKKTGLYNPDAILDALSKAAQSNSEATVIAHYNSAGDTDTDPLIGDPLKTSIQYNGIGMNTTFFLTKWYSDLLTNTFTGGSGVEDPRTDKLIPAAEFKDAGGNIVLQRSQTVDMMQSNIRLTGGPILANYDPAKGWVVTTSNAARKGDSVYVNLRSQGAMYYATAKDDDTYRATDGRILSTGTFYTRPDAPTDLLSYPELCFIKAEVHLRRNAAGLALTAYKDGIEAHMRLMNEKLRQYPVTTNTGKQPMTEAAITSFLASAAVAQSAGELTMAKIMQQKFIACSFSQQNWNDMRRFNFSAGNVGSFGVVYPDFERPYEFGGTALNKMIGAGKTDPRYWFRRISQCSHEVNYNSTNLRASNPEAFLDKIWSLPVWWDIEE